MKMIKQTITIVFLFLFSNNYSYGYDYLGCYSDTKRINTRTLPYALLEDKEMTIHKCMIFCSERQFLIAGIEYGRECWCGYDIPSPDLKLDEDKCHMPCKGDHKSSCGGNFALSTYKLDQMSVPESLQPDRLLLCLVMIVKDEAHNIESVLSKLVDFIDCWVILDTGSTDGTQAKINYALSNKPGHLFSGKFIDYATTRNEVLNLTLHSFNPVFTLMLSGDEHVRNPNYMISFLQSVRYSSGKNHEAYHIQLIVGESKVRTPRIARVDSLWRYKGRVHEWLLPPQTQQKHYDQFDSPDFIQVDFIMSDGERRFKNQKWQIDLLMLDLRDMPKDHRTTTLLGTTFEGLLNYTQAIFWYRKLIELALSSDEKYQIYMKIADLYHLLYKKEHNIEWKQKRYITLLQAHEIDTTNSEAIYNLAHDYFLEKKNNLAFLFALNARKIGINNKSKQYHFFRKHTSIKYTDEAYDNELNRLLAFSARRVFEYCICAENAYKVLLFDSNDTPTKNLHDECQKECIVDTIDNYQNLTYHMILKNHSFQFPTILIIYPVLFLLVICTVRIILYYYKQMIYNIMMCFRKRNYYNLSNFKLPE